jgi:hypothetical protein
MELPYVPDFLLVMYELRYGAGVITDDIGGSETGSCEERGREGDLNNVEVTLEEGSAEA